MLLVIDTNIIVNALKSRDSQAKSVRLMRDIMSGKYTMCVSPEIMQEYQDVLFRQHLSLNKDSVSRLLNWIKQHAFFIIPKPSSPSSVKMIDEDDRIFFDTAKCVNARLVTRNYKHYPVHELITLIDELY